MPKDPSPTVELLRGAVSSGDYPEADRLLGDFREQVQMDWVAATSVEQRASIVAEVGGLLEWARTATLAARAHAQRRLIHLACEKAYTASSR
jgi:hypothetical protein